MIELKAIQRYAESFTVSLHNQMMPITAHMKPDDSGEWVKYDDVLAAVEKLTIENRGLRITLDECFTRDEQDAAFTRRDGWRDVMKELPDAAGKYIIYINGKVIYGSYHVNSNEWEILGVTHWMPLPASPEGEK